jgi:hypothetical protein
MLPAGPRRFWAKLRQVHWEFWRNHTGNIARLFETYYHDRPNFDGGILLVGDSIQF